MVTGQHSQWTLTYHQGTVGSANVLHLYELAISMVVHLEQHLEKRERERERERFFLISRDLNRQKYQPFCNQRPADQSLL